MAWAAGCSTPAGHTPPVGRLARHFADSTRTDWDGRAPRPLDVTVWYPAARGSREEPWGVGVFQFGNSARDAVFGDSLRHPLVVLSHGTGGSVAQLAWLAESLVGQGFIVAGVNHHGNTGAEDRPRPGGFVLPWERARDLSVLIDRLTADSAIAPHLDTTRIGAAGFSLGGYTVLALAGAHFSFADLQQRCTSAPTAAVCTLPPEATFTMADVDSLARTDAAFQAAMARGARPTRDARIRAVYAIAPALVPVLDTTGLQADTVPIQVVLGASDTQVVPAPTAAWLARHAPAVRVETRQGVTHYGYLAECTLRGRVFLRALCTDGATDRTTLHASVAGDVARFFRQSLASGR